MKKLFSYHQFFIESCKREIRNRYMDSSIGFSWLFLNPIMQLAIYYFVFEKIFQIKFNTLAGHNFLSFLAVALWPWVAFSEGLFAATNAIEKHKDLLKKMSVPKLLLVTLEAIVPFIIHFLGLVFILLIITIVFSQPVQLQMIPVALIIYCLQFIFCLGLGLLLSSLQVFLKDICQILSPVIMVWFYITPIIYPPSLVPESLKFILEINPISVFVTAYREVLLEGNLSSFFALNSIGIMLLSSTITMIIGWTIFNRLQSKFEDLF